MSEKRARRSRVLEVLQKQEEESKTGDQEEGSPLDGIDEAFGLTDPK